MSNPPETSNEVPDSGQHRLTLRLNIASAGNGIPTLSLEQLTALARESAPVDIYATASAKHPVGRASNYEMVGPDLWATCTLDITAEGARAAAMIASQPDGTLKLVAVWLTNLQRPWIEAVGADLTPSEAAQYALGRSAWKRRSPS